MSNSDVNADFFLDEDENHDSSSLTASGIAEYIRFNCCPRFFKLKFEGKDVKKRKWPEAFKSISPLLYGAGKLFEEKKISEIKKKSQFIMTSPNMILTSTVGKKLQIL